MKHGQWKCYGIKSSASHEVLMKNGFHCINFYYLWSQAKSGFCCKHDYEKLLHLRHFKASCWVQTSFVGWETSEKTPKRGRYRVTWWVRREGVEREVLVSQCILPYILLLLKIRNECIEEKVISCAYDALEWWRPLTLNLLFVYAADCSHCLAFEMKPNVDGWLLNGSLEVVQKRSLELLQIKGNQNSYQILSPFIPPITEHFVLMVDKLLFSFDGFSFNSIFTFFGTTSN